MLQPKQEDEEKSSARSRSARRRGASPNHHKVPALNMSGIRGQEGETPRRLDSDELLKPRSNREVHQPPGTVLKISAMEWNNVPPITYEAIVQLVHEIDAINSRAVTAKTDMKRTFDEQRVVIRNTETV